MRPHLLAALLLGSSAFAGAEEPCTLPPGTDGVQARLAYARGLVAGALGPHPAVRVLAVTVDGERLAGVDLSLDDPGERAGVAAALRALCPSLEIRFPEPAVPRAPRSRWRGWIEWLRAPPGRRAIRLPEGVLFVPPLADQKQPRFHVTFQRYRTDFGTYDVGSVGFGENFGLLRWPGEREGDGWQLGISGAVFAIFNLDAESMDLLNADYYIGFPVEVHSGRFSGRLRLFHLSSHLGDEFLLNPQPGPPVERINLSYEALEALAAYERRGARVYAGAIRILSSDTPLRRNRVQAGAEYRSRHLGRARLRLVAGADLEAWSETDWDIDTSVKAGIVFPNARRLDRSIQVLLEFYDGHAPHGQFYPLRVRYLGAGFGFSL
ncbi:MAG: DUF1207 domain-containing protein [Acidobacteria bacterium]|nr:MAG: DUF1207 domain-containing protein [Acidobacteriota bacterium]